MKKEFEISLKVAGSDHESVIKTFCSHFEEMKKAGFSGGYNQDWATGGSGGHFLGLCAFISGPPQRPLSDAELRQVRELLK